MNFNAGNFNESLKYTFQQFSKQEAEARERSRQLLIRLDRFEAKALELGSRTRKALQIKNHYERTLMHQHPLIWSHIQRNLVHTMGDVAIPAGVSEAFTIRSTREMAINTSLSSSPSDQNSLHEGVWPHSPSPYPEQTTAPLPRENSLVHSNNETCKLNEDIPQVAALNTMHENEASEGRNSQVKISYSEEPRVGAEIQLPRHHQHNCSFTMQEKQITRILESAPYSDCLVEGYDQQHAIVQERQPNPEHAKGQETQNPVFPSFAALDSSANASKAPFSNNGNFETHKDVTQQDDTPSKEAKVYRTFQLDSESECADDPISGPSIGQNGEGDDSDSFWN